MEDDAYAMVSKSKLKLKGGLKLKKKKKKGVAGGGKKEAVSSATAPEVDEYEAKLAEAKERARLQKEIAQVHVGVKRKRGREEEERPTLGKYAKKEDGGEGDGEDPTLIGLTEFEKKHELRRREQEAREFKKKAGKSHRERVDDFNERLAKAPVHHDVPKVSAAGNG